MASPIASALASKLCDPSEPVFLYGTVPPLEGTTDEKVEEQAASFAKKMAGLSVDGFIVYDIQEEKGRTPEPRPFAFRKMMEPSGYAGLLQKKSGKGVVLYKCVAEHSVGNFEGWADAAVNTHGLKCFNLVGGATSSVTYTGPTMDEAAKVMTARGAKLGGVTIAERHTKKCNEHTTVMRKQNMGMKWFISQAIYDDKQMVNFINDYGALCKSESKAPVKMILTFAPCGREKTMKFIDWLGVVVPPETRSAILDAENKAATSVNLLCDMLRNIIKETAGSGVPLGVSVESVSIFKDEVAATDDLFRRSQAILLDSMGLGWSVRWGWLAPKKDEKKKEVVQMIGVAVAAAAAGFVGGRRLSSA